MNGAKTVAAILSEPWLIDKQYVMSNLPMVWNILEGKYVPEAKLQSGEQQIGAEHGIHRVKGTAVGNPYFDYWTGEWVIPVVEGQDNIIELVIDQPLLRHDNCGDKGTSTYSEIIHKISNTDHVTAVLINMNCPGGQASGTQMMAQALRNLEVPTATLVNDGMAASGGYWLASQTQKLYASNKTSSVGSIGAYMSFYDIREYLNKEGVTEHSVYSKYSDDKNKDYLDALEGEYDGIRTKLDFLVEAFVEQVQEARNISAAPGEGPFSGKMYFAEEAREIGLIDGIRSKEEVVEELINMSNNGATQYVI